MRSLHAETLGLIILTLCPCGAGPPLAAEPTAVERLGGEHLLVLEGAQDIFGLIDSGDMEGLAELLEKDAGQLEVRSKGLQLLPISHAVSAGNSEAVAVLLDHGADVETDHYGETLLMMAAYGAHPDVVRLLLESGAEVDRVERHRTALRSAVWGGSTQVVRLLLEAGADPARSETERLPSILHVAAEVGNAEVVRLLLAHEFFALDAGDPSSKNTPLHEAALNGNTEAAAALLESGAPVEARGELGRTPLHLACSGGHLAVVRLLLGAKANVLAGDLLGTTPIHIAAREGRDAILWELLYFHDELPEVDVRDDRGWTPLHEAAAFGARHALWRLVMEGADIDAKTGFRRTPLHLAALRRDYNTVEVLLRYRADPSAEDANGETTLDYLEAAVPPTLGAVLSGTQIENAPTGTIEIPEWDGSDPVAGLYLDSNAWPGPQGVRIAVWEDGVVLFSPFRRSPGHRARVGLIDPERAGRLVASLTDVGLRLYRRFRRTSDHPAFEVLSVRDGEGRRSYAWECDLLPRYAYYPMSSAERSVSRMLDLAELILARHVPRRSFALITLEGTTPFRGHDWFEGTAPEWAR